MGIAANEGTIHRQNELSLATLRIPLDLEELKMTILICKGSYGSEHPAPY